MKDIEKLPIRPFTRFCMSIGAVPSSYLAGLSIEEQLLWLCSYLEKEVIPVINNTSEVVEELKNFVEHYFDNLDVQEEINNKLDDMAESGELEEIIAAYLNTKAIFGFDNIEQMKEADNLINGSYAKTLGYYAQNDGGSATYKIRNITNEDIVDEMFIIALSNPELIGELIIQDQINVKTLGAKGDGIQNDTSYIQAALDKTNNVYIPNGTYLIDTISLNDFNQLSGENKWKTILYSTEEYIIDSDKRYLTINNIQLKSDVTFSGLQSDEIDVGSGTTGIRLNYSNDGTPDSYDTKIFIDDVVINYCGGNGIVIDGTITGTHLTNIECIIIGQNAYEINGTDSKIIGCVAANIGGTGFNIIGTSTQISTCKAFLCGNLSSSGFGFRLTGDYATVSSITTEENYSTSLQINSNMSNITGVCVNGSGNIGKYSNIPCVKITGSYNLISGTISNKIVNCYAKYGIYLDSGTNNKIDFKIRELSSVARNAVDKPDMIYLYGTIQNPFNQLLINSNNIITEPIDLMSETYTVERSGAAQGNVTADSEGNKQFNLTNASSLNANGEQGVSMTFDLDLDEIKANPIISVHARCKCGNNDKRYVEMMINGTIQNGNNYYSFDNMHPILINRESSQEYTDIYYIGDLSSRLNDSTNFVRLKVSLVKVNSLMNDNSINCTGTLTALEYNNFSNSSY